MLSRCDIDLWESLGKFIGWKSLQVALDWLAWPFTQRIHLLIPGLKDGSVIFAPDPPGMLTKLPQSQLGGMWCFCSCAQPYVCTERCTHLLLWYTKRLSRSPKHFHTNTTTCIRPLICIHSPTWLFCCPKTIFGSPVSGHHKSLPLSATQALHSPERELQIHKNYINK